MPLEHLFAGLAQMGDKVPEDGQSSQRPNIREQSYLKVKDGMVANEGKYMYGLPLCAYRIEEPAVPSDNQSVFVFDKDGRAAKIDGLASLDQTRGSRTFSCRAATVPRYGQCRVHNPQ